MPLIDLNLGRLGNPIADGLNMLQQARERQKQMDMERAKMVMQQQNQDTENKRADSYLKLQQDQFARTGQNQEDEHKRQGAEDYQKIYQASGHDPKMARELAKAYGYEIVDGPNGPTAVQSVQSVQMPKADAPALMTPGGMGSDNGVPQAGAGPAAISPPPQPNPSVGGGGPFMAGPPQLQPGQAAPNAQRGMPDFLADEISNVRPNNPLAFAQAVSNVDVTPEQAAAMGHPPGPGDVQDQHAELMGQPRAPAAAPPPQPTEAQMTAQADKINPILAAFRMRKGSQDLMVDPNAAKAAEEASFADQLKLKQAAPEARMAAAAVEAAKKRTFDESQNALYKSEGLTFDQRKQLAEVGAAGRVNAARASALSPLRADQGNRQDMSTLRQELKDWRARNTFDVDSKTNRRLQTAMGNLTSGNAMQQREAAESLVSIFKGGGQVTKASQDLLLKHLGGIVGDAQSWLEGLSSGHYGSRELGVLKEAANSALDEQKSRMQETYQSAVDDFGPGSAYENMGGNVNHEIKSHFRQFGLDVPDIYSNGAPKVTLGSGSRPTPKKTNPIVKAKKTQNLAAPDKAAVDWANSNPNDPRSAAILRANGL